MNLTPLLVVLLGVVTVCGCNRLKPYNSPTESGHGPRVIKPQYQYLSGKRDDPIYHRDRNYNKPNPKDHSQVVLTASGLVPPVFLPRNQDGSLNLDIIPKYAEFLSHNDVKTVEILGTVGEGPALSMADKQKVIDAWVRAGRKFNMHIMVQVGAVPYPDVIATARYAQEAGADSIITLPEVYYTPATIEELVEFIRAVGNAAPHLPVLYYHNPNMTGVVYPPQEIVRTARAHVPNFRGIKYSFNDLSPLTATLDVLRPGQNLFIAIDQLIAPAALLGVRSALSGSINFWPLLVQEIFDAIEHSDVKRASELQKNLNLGFEAIMAAGNTVSALKATMEIVTGIKMGPPGPPLPPITQTARNTLERQLKALGLAYNRKD